MKQHSRRLNIKTTKLASLTAIFRSKKKPPTESDGALLPAMDIDGEEHPPSNQGGDPEATPEGPIQQRNGSETAESGNESDGASEGMLADSDSDDEFESDTEGVDGRGDAVATRSLEFEVRAAIAGNVPYQSQGLSES